MKDDSDYDKNMLNMKLAQLKTREPLNPLRDYQQIVRIWNNYRKKLSVQT